MIDVSAIERLMLGHYTVPEDIAARVGPPLAGKQIAVTGFLIRHPQGPFVFDTGFGQGNDENTSGHQSLVVETRQGRIVLAGQAQNFASEHAISHYARALRQRGEPHADYPAWVDRFAELDPWRVLFAHDLAIWERAPR